MLHSLPEITTPRVSCALICKSSSISKGRWAGKNLRRGLLQYVGLASLNKPSSHSHILQTLFLNGRTAAFRQNAWNESRRPTHLQHGNYELHSARQHLDFCPVRWRSRLPSSCKTNGHWKQPRSSSCPVLPPATAPWTGLSSVSVYVFSTATSSSADPHYYQHNPRSPPLLHYRVAPEWRTSHCSE